ncbi:class I SAM-dependent methyltransferase [Sphingomonas sp.]|uniref:class I SAM-dependent methyltransferase n=1 Tax=Sphingomonas sp. TaxID=28214 RepID=UPI002DD67158|nr:methyltransferase domain-containing protein [Sphingomonas sp.]
MSGLKTRLLNLALRSETITIALFLTDNALATLGLSRANPAPQEHLSGETVEADVTYARQVVSSYSMYGAAKGRVAEIGPGGSAATALLLIDEGADTVALLDRFVFPHDPELLGRTYHAIIQRSPKLTALFPDPTDLHSRITFESGEPAAAEQYFARNGNFDAVCSCAVLEHVSDPILALESMTAALKTGGVLVHYVDFRDHGMFTSSGKHELTFLKVASWLYPHMSRRRGRPNRVLIDRYRTACDRLGLDYEILATSLVGPGSLPAPIAYEKVPEGLRSAAEARVEEIRPKLAMPFRSMDARDLAIDSIVLVARKRQ